jgi:hypothetical protein
LISRRPRDPDVHTYDVFGSAAPGVEGIISSIRAVQQSLGLELEKRSSSYSNGHYLMSRDARHGVIRHLNNESRDPEEVPYLEYPGYRTIVSVDYATDPDATATLLISAGLTHLRRRTRRRNLGAGNNDEPTPSEDVALPF